MSDKSYLEEYLDDKEVSSVTRYWNLESKMACAAFLFGMVIAIKPSNDIELQALLDLNLLHSIKIHEGE